MRNLFLFLGITLIAGALPMNAQSTRGIVVNTCNPQNCPDYMFFLKEGDSYLNQTEPAYAEALRKFRAAQIASRVCNCDDERLPLAKIDTCVAGIEKLLRRAKLAEQRAIREANKNKRALREQIRLYNVLDKRGQQLKDALNRVEVFRNRFDELQFAFGRFVVWNRKDGDGQKYFFIDKEGEETVKLRQWDYASNFDEETGYATVALSSENYKVSNNAPIQVRRRAPNTKAPPPLASNPLDPIVETGGSSSTTDTGAGSTADFEDSVSRPDSGNDPEESSGIETSASEELNTVGDRMYFFVLDTFGRAMRAAFNMSDLSPDTEYADLRSKVRSDSAIKRIVRLCPNLKVLLLSRNYLSELPPEIGQLKELEVLDLEANYFRSLPDEITNLENLKELNLAQTYYLSELPLEFGRLKSLTHLNLSNSRLTRFPTTFFNDLNNLQSLNITQCPIEELPNAIGNLQDLRELRFGYAPIESLPNSIGRLKNLEVLAANYSALKTLPESIGKLENLTHLDLFDCLGLEDIPEEVWSLQNLRSFGIYLESSESLSPQLWERSGIVELRLSGPGVRDIPEEVTQLTNLKKLTLSKTELSTFPAVFGSINGLTHLNIYDNDLEVLPEEMGNLTNLESLNISSNQNLIRLPGSLSQLKKLDTLTLDFNPYLESLPESIGQLENLVYLTIIGSSISHLPESIGQLKNLDYLDIYDNGILEEIPASIGNLTNLRQLDLSANYTLDTIPATIGNLKRLEELYLTDLDIRHLPERFGELERLKYLDIYENERLESLPESFGKLKNLTSLDLENNSSLRALPASFSNLSALESLILSFTSLETLPEDFGRLTNLKSLRMSDLEFLKRLPDSFGELENLQDLTLTGNPNLREVPDSFKNLSKLTYLSISNSGFPKDYKSFLQRILPWCEIYDDEYYD